MKRYGFQFKNFCEFIYQVKNGKKALILGPDYVVMSTNYYNELKKEVLERPLKKVWFDESGDFPWS